ncbi:MAG: YdcF family protein, partial [Proteobacteria bacterium]|nr:YdcF family protein [Pseudomonadota bacterium]
MTALVRALAWLLERPLVVDDAYRPLDAIVVLGAPLGPGGVLTPVLAERVDAAARLYRMGAGRLVVATGGVTGGAPRAEAVAIAEALRAHGIPNAALVVEDAARTTADNARLSAALLRARGARTAWIVSQPFHGRRAAYLFARAGIA